MRQNVVAGTTLAVLALVGCGKNGPSYGNPKSSGSSAPAGAPVSLAGTVNDHGTKDLAGKDEFELELDNFYFNPTFIKVAPGSKVKVELSNEGSAPHTFTVDALHVDQQVAPGKSMDVTITLPASGALAFYCKFHKGQGMQGALYFNAGDKVTGGTSSGDSGGAYGQ